MNVKATIGIHPCEVADGLCTYENYIQAISRLEELYIANQEHIVGIGECGIDTYYPESDKTIDLQKVVFHAQCVLATTYTMPVVIHSRANRDATRDVMIRFR